MHTTKKQYYDAEGSIIVRPYRLKDLATIYDVSTRTMRRWIDAKLGDTGKKTTKYFMVEQVKSIMDVVGYPQKIATVIQIQTPLKQVA
jgi:uncharacterized protein YjcR